MRKILLGIISLLLIASRGYCELPKKVDAKVKQFHLTALGRKPSQVEKQVIEQALVLMEANDVRTDYPLRSVRYDDKMQEWVLEFNDMRPDAALWVFIKDQDATYFEVKYNLIKNRVKYGQFSPSQLSPWTGKTPNPYENENHQLVKDSYKEKWIESSIEKYPEAVTKAKEVLREWGQNPDKYEYEGKTYDYEIHVSESPNFISVVFLPIGLEGLERHVEVRMTKKDLAVLSILPGA